MARAVFADCVQAAQKEVIRKARKQCWTSWSHCYRMANLLSGVLPATSITNAIVALQVFVNCFALCHALQYSHGCFSV